MYYSPESFGLELVATLNHSDEPYEFDMTIVLVDRSGGFFYASDAGCSCPSPFEGHKMEDLVPFADINELARYIHGCGGTAGDVFEFLFQVRRAMM